jgi:hypothetical protein
MEVKPIGRAFEVDEFERVDPKVPEGDAERLTLPFSVR